MYYPLVTDVYIIIVLHRALYCKTQHSGRIHILLTYNITVNEWGSSSVIKHILMYYPLALHLKIPAWSIVEWYIFYLPIILPWPMMLYLGVPPMRIPTDDATNRIFKWELFNHGYYVRLDSRYLGIKLYDHPTYYTNHAHLMYIKGS